MQTFLSKELRETAEGREVDNILRACVHCGFCNATCPTYQLLGDERDGPRGRIYLIKEMLESGTASRETQRRLDRCLTCRSCETTCPSGVQYNRLLEIGRATADAAVPRPLTERVQRELLLRTIPDTGRLRMLIRLARMIRPLLPAALKKTVSNNGVRDQPWPGNAHRRRILLLQGCAQSVMAPRINLAAARVLNRLGIQAVPASGCCGALSHHLSAEQQTLAAIRNNIDRWWPQIEDGAEALLITASGCAPTVKDYGHLLRHDREYSDRANRLAEKAQDISEFIERQELEPLRGNGADEALIAFHSPCTLQHGLQRNGKVEQLLAGLGFRLTPVRNAHLCCGSAGTYSILQKKLSNQLLQQKLACLEEKQPDLIATANIGCMMHLQGGTNLPVRHWIELLADRA